MKNASTPPTSSFASKWSYTWPREAQVRAARANLFPTLSAGPSISRDRVSANRPLATPGSTTTYSDFVIAGQASWEPDFWGRIRRTIEQARANAQADAAQQANVALTLHAEMATDYFALRGLDSQIRFLTDTVTDLEHQLDLTQRRFHGGVATEVDVAQAQTQLETVRAQLVDLGVARAQFEHAIGTLANDSLPDFSIPPSPLDLTLPKIPIGVPSQLLERRPDIAQAERIAAAANEQIGINIAAFYPTISLTGTGGFESTNPGTWIQGPSSLWSLGAQATELLFDAGQRHALTDVARHNYEAQADGYRNTVFQAFDDVEDQLAALRILEQESETEQRAVDAAPSLLRSLQHTLQRRRHELSWKCLPPNRHCCRTRSPPSISRAGNSPPASAWCALSAAAGTQRSYRDSSPKNLSRGRPRSHRL